MIIAGIAVIATALYLNLDKIHNFENQINISLTNFFNLKNIIFLAIVLAICIYLIWRAIIAIRKAYYGNKNRKSDISHHYWRIRDILIDFRDHKIGLEAFIQALKKEISCISGIAELKEDRDMLELKLFEAEKEMIKQKHEKSLDYIEARKHQEQKEIEELEKKEKAD